MNTETDGGEADAPPPQPVDHTHAPRVPVRKNWPVLLGQAMRTGTWVIAQVQLVGAVECRVPSPSTVLTVGGRWQVSGSSLRMARAALVTHQREQIMNYLMREDQVVEVEIEGVKQWRAYPPAMHQEEEEAFEKLWRRLREMNGRWRIDVTSHDTPPDGGDGDVLAKEPPVVTPTSTH